MTEVSSLSFVSHAECEETPTDYWDIEPTGDWGHDNARGRELATECVGFIRETGDIHLLKNVNAAMVWKRQHSGVEVGFWSAVAAHVY